MLPFHSTGLQPTGPAHSERLKRTITKKREKRKTAPAPLVLCVFVFSFRSNGLGLPTAELILLCLTELLSRLLTSAFESYDLENMITAFLLARQGSLEGPSIFPSYADWFKVGHELFNVRRHLSVSANGSQI